MKNNYIIRPREASDFSDFVELRSKVFGDDAEFIEFFDACFRDDYLDFLIIEDQDGKNALQASLTQFDMGKLVVPEGKVSDIAGKSIEMSYAICTDPAARGKGYGSHITVYAREIAESSRKLSVLSPAEPSLIKFYEPLEYKTFMYAEQGTVVPSEQSDFSFSELKFELISPQQYNDHREVILANRVHIKLSTGALHFAAGLTATGGAVGSAPTGEAAGSALTGSGLLLISDGAEPLAIAACESVGADSLAATELLTFSENGGHKELGIAIAKALAVRFGAVRCDCMMPSRAGSKSAAALGMISVSEDELAEVYSAEQGECPPYMGFTFG